MQIQSDIPAPPFRRANLAYRYYPWSGMAVGDSFFEPEITITSLSSAATRAGQRLGVRFTCRTVVESGLSGVRVWRVE
jgi:hypothetical protein